MKVLRKCTAVIVHGEIGAPMSGWDGQVTEIETEHGIAWVRESIRRNVLESANARLSVKRGKRVPPGEWVLDLAVDQPSSWEPIAELVAAEDALKRTVRRSPRWTKATALQAFARDARED